MDEDTQIRSGKVLINVNDCIYYPGVLEYCLEALRTNSNTYIVGVATIYKSRNKPYTSTYYDNEGHFEMSGDIVKSLPRKNT